MVEAAGIEPASEDLQRQVSSMLSLFFFSRGLKAEEASSQAASPDRLSPSWLRANQVGQPVFRRLFRSQRPEPERRLA